MLAESVETPRYNPRADGRSSVCSGCAAAPAATLVPARSCTAPTPQRASQSLTVPSAPALARRCSVQNSTHVTAGAGAAIGAPLRLRLGGGRERAPKSDGAAACASSSDADATRKDGVAATAAPSGSDCETALGARTSHCSTRPSRPAVAK